MQVSGTRIRDQIAAKHGEIVRRQSAALTAAA
jgi:hypothetical protein